MPISPSSPSLATISYGKRFSRSSSSATGRTSPSAKSRTSRRICSCSSVRSNRMGRGCYCPRPRFYAGRSMVSLPLILAQAGSGSGGFGGGGGGGGGGFSGGGGSSGTGEGDPIVVVVVFGLFGLFLLYLAIHTVRYRRKLREREARVRTASAEAAEDDAYFEADELERHAAALFRAAQAAWDARDREGLARLVGPDLLVEWNRRLDDFDSKGWQTASRCWRTRRSSTSGLRTGST